MTNLVMVILAFFVGPLHDINLSLCQAFHIVSPLSSRPALSLLGGWSKSSSDSDCRRQWRISSNHVEHSHAHRIPTITTKGTQFTTKGQNFKSSTTACNMTPTTIVTETMSPSSVLAVIQQTLCLFSKSSLGTSSASASVALESITDALSTTPPFIYFLCLIAAGFGVPVSEDAMCIFAGTILPSIWTADPGKRNRLLLALYGGVVLSDIITFCIGRALKMGILEPIRKRMNLQTDRIEFCKDDEDIPNIIINDDNIDQENNDDNDDDVICQVETPKLRKRDRVLKKLENAGDYAGFVIRFSVGFRAPMMIFAGFSGKVPLSKYVIGTCIGAIGSLSLQLSFGYVMRYNPAAVVGIIASISTFVALVPVMIGLISSISLMWQKYRIRRIL